jgi:ABC-type glycerol-3-phosphate transport system substrate-binding protein
MNLRTKIAAPLVGATIMALALTGCSSGSSDTGTSGNEKVTITVGDKPSADQKAALAVFEENVKAFEKKYPNITIKGAETVWDAQTFQANVAGGTLPTVMKVPFTEIQSLIARGQVADITDALKSAGFSDDLNPQTAKIAQNKDGRTFGVPVAPYALGLFYNRELFTQAGLDPDKPPATWDELRADAKAIAQKTGQAGYATMTNENTGGWMLTAQVYSLDGSIENAKGTKSTINSAPTKQALNYLKQMRWEDDSMGAEFLYNMTDIAKNFAAGKIGMFISVPSASYGAAVANYGMPKESVGLTAIPGEDGPGKNVLAGGSVEIVNPKSSAAEKDAAVKWVHFTDIGVYLDKDTAVTRSKATAADGGTVGIPRLSPVSQAEYKKYEAWIKPYVNVDLDHMTGYTSQLDSMTLKTEPVNSAQEVYAALDVVVQKVLTDQSTDIDALLKQTASTVDTKLARASR